MEREIRLLAGGAEEEVCGGVTRETAEEGGCCRAAEEIWLLTAEKIRLLAEGAERKMIAADGGEKGREGRCQRRYRLGGLTVKEAFAVSGRARLMTVHVERQSLLTAEDIGYWQEGSRMKMVAVILSKGLRLWKKEGSELGSGVLTAEKRRLLQQRIGYCCSRGEKIAAAEERRLLQQRREDCCNRGEKIDEAEERRLLQQRRLAAEN